MATPKLAETTQGPVGTVVLWIMLLSLHPLPSDTKKIVHIPASFTSHVKYHTNVARALHELGHQVWLAMPDYLVDKGVLNTANITLIQYHLSHNYEDDAMNLFLDGYFQGKRVHPLSSVAIAREFCDEILRKTDVEQKIRDIQPDLIIIDNLPHMHTLTVLPYKLRVPHAMVGTVYDILSTRIPYSSAVNALQMGVHSDDMTFFQRVQNMFMHIALQVHNPFMDRDVVSIYAPEMPYIPNSQLISRAEIWLVELDHILDYPRPTLPNVKLIGGTATGLGKPLPPEFQSFMDGASEGVIIVSFGSYVLGVPKFISDKLLKVFQELPMKVVFRSNLTSPDTAKIFMSRWLPQNDLLAHPNTKLFVSHCGKNGQYEALFHAIPILCTPMFADQPYNSERIRKKGFGEVVDLRTVSQQQLLTHITTVARDPRYKQTISKASSLFRQLYGVPMQEAAKWLDHVMQYGGDYMRYAGQKMPLYQFLQLDVLMFVFGLGALSSVLIYLCVKMCWRCCFKKKSKSD